MSVFILKMIILSDVCFCFENDYFVISPVVKILPIFVSLVTSLFVKYLYLVFFYCKKRVNN